MTSKANLKLVYTAGKYTAPHPYLTDNYIHYAKLFSQEICKRGAVGVAPHMLTAHFDGLAPYEFWIEATMELMVRCDAVFMIPNWKLSSGAKGEEAEAKKLGMPIFYAQDLVTNAPPVDSDFLTLEAWLAAHKELQT